MNYRILNQLFPILIILLFIQNNFGQDEIEISSPNLISEGIPKVSRNLFADLVGAFNRKQSAFITWKKDGSVIGYTDDYSPFTIGTNGERTDYKIYLNAPEDIQLNPSLQNSFLYTADSEGNENEQLFKYDFDEKQSIQLTKEPEIKKINSFLWSQTGNSIYIINADEKKHAAELYSINPVTKELSKLASFDGVTRYLSDSKDDLIVFYNYISNSQTVYYLFDNKTKQVTQLTKETAFFKQAKFSADSNGIYWLSDREGGFFNLYYYDLKTRITTKVNKQELNITSFKFSPDQKRVAFKINDSGAEKLRIFQVLNNQTTDELPQPEIKLGVIERYGWKNNDELGFSFESHKNPPEIKIYNTTSSKLATFASSEANQSLVGNLQDTQKIKWKSFDNREISGFLVKPKIVAPGTKLPVLIDIHGGPKLQYQPFYSVYKTYPTAYLDAVTILPNIRGSSGFGREFENLDNAEKREDAFKDLEALLLWVKTQPDLDSDRIVLKGDSFGSFMALGLGVRNPDKIKAIIAETPVISLKNTYNFSAKSVQDALISEYGSTGLMETLEKLSPLNQENLSKWKIPVLLSIGQNDTRVPISDVELFKENLKKANVPVWFLKAKNEGHFWSNYENKIFLNVSEISFLKKQGGF